MIISEQSKIGEINMSWLHDQIQLIIPSHNEHLNNKQPNYIVKPRFISATELDVEMPMVRWTIELDDVYASARLFDENSQLLAIGMPDPDQEDFENRFAETVIRVIDERLS